MRGLADALLVAFCAVVFALWAWVTLGSGTLSGMTP
jgi:hypothetical protein